MTLAEQLGVELERPPVASLADALRGEIRRVTLKRNRWKSYATSIGPPRAFAGAIRQMNVVLGLADYAIQSGSRKLMEDSMRSLVQLHDLD